MLTPPPSPPLLFPPPRNPRGGDSFIFQNAVENDIECWLRLNYVLLCSVFECFSYFSSFFLVVCDSFSVFIFRLFLSLSYPYPPFSLISMFPPPCSYFLFLPVLFPFFISFLCLLSFLAYLSIFLCCLCPFFFSIQYLLSAPSFSCSPPFSPMSLLPSLSLVFFFLRPRIPPLCLSPVSPPSYSPSLVTSFYLSPQFLNLSISYLLFLFTLFSLVLL